MNIRRSFLYPFPGSKEVKKYIRSASVSVKQLCVILNIDFVVQANKISFAKVIFIKREIYKILFSFLGQEINIK